MNLMRTLISAALLLLAGCGQSRVGFATYYAIDDPGKPHELRRISEIGLPNDGKIDLIQNAPEDYAIIEVRARGDLNIDIYRYELTTDFVRLSMINGQIDAIGGGPIILAK